MNWTFINKKKVMSVKTLFSLFIFLPFIIFSQEQKRLIADYFQTKQSQNSKKLDLLNFDIDNVDYSKSLGGEVIKIQQKFKGCPIYNAVGTALIKENKILYFSDSFVKNYDHSTSNIPLLSKESALRKIVNTLQNKDLENYLIIENTLSEPHHKKCATQKLVFVEVNSDLRLAYQFFLTEKKSSNSWNILVDANTGEIINKDNLKLSCSFHPGAFVHDHSSESLIKIQNKESKSSYLLSPDNASYNIFPLPIESPTFGSRSVVNNPWILASSPEGWHSDGSNHYTITRGNNVYAYEDSANSNTPGYSPDGGINRNFNFPFSINGTPAFNQNAAITNLFYINNRVHDIFYQFGFTESARNFQQNNFGKGGLGNDFVVAEAQDSEAVSYTHLTLPTKRIV